jgi:hypothetical protein
MALIADPVKRANKVTTEKQAAQLRDELEVELALNDQTPEGWDQQAESALDILGRTFPGMEGYQFGEAHPPKSGGPSLSHRAKQGLHSPEPEHQARDEHQAKQGGPEPHARKTRRQRVRQGLELPNYVRNAPVPPVAGTASIAELVVYTIGGVMGLVLLYNLTTGNGPKAVEVFVATTTNFVRAITGPVDPLRPRASATAAAAAGRPVASSSIGNAIAAAAAALPQPKKP